MNEREKENKGRKNKVKKGDFDKERVLVKVQNFKDTRC